MNTSAQVLEELVRIIAARAGASADTSYTAQLLSRGVEHCARKVGEEAIEFVIAAVSGNRDHTRDEAADLVYHLLVALQASGVSLDAVAEELSRRQGIGGLEEKASRETSQDG
jgi:phosphoribosyl-ATP pyrophosphohydrolase